MSTFFADIQGAIRTQLSTLPGDLPTSWENIEFKEDSKTLFIRGDFLPADTVQACFGDLGQDIHNGIFQVSVFIPNNAGRSTLPDELADHFRRGIVLTQNGVNVRIQSTSLGAALKDDNFYIVPVSIRYQAFTNART